MSNDKNNVEQTSQSDQSGSPEEYLSIGLGDPDKGPKDSDIGTVFVNQDLRIKSIVSTVTELVNQSSFNVDLELDDFNRQFRYDNITDDINHVLENQERIKKELPAKNDRWYLIELRPHVTEDENNGVVITFVDVTELKEAKEKLAKKIEKIKDLQRQIIKNDVSERWRIGQYLHDDLSQTLVSAEFLLKNVRSKLANGEKDIKEDIDQLIDILSQSMTDVRDLSHEIVPVDIEEKGITHAFNSFARQLEKVHDIHCELEYDHAVDKIDSLEIATHLYRIAHEATKNAAIHGDAENVKITFASDDDYLYLNIEDDGIGFSDSAKEEGGMGINIMRHRMELIGGTFEIKDTSDPGNKGTTISCKIPAKELYNPEGS